MPVTRTLGPLHFEDLEPTRFEDLVRQLLYDFRPWQKLEATGRSGSDDGFDARGYENLPSGEGSEDTAGEVEAIVERPGRLWLIQCKREKVISPKKLAAYLNDARLNPGEQLHGIIFAAACDFSKKSRDTFRQGCEALGIDEWHLWGKAELEDMLFQPKNDSLLFAYFGISLTIRRRGMRSALSSRLAMKRRAHNALDSKLHAHLLVIDPAAEDYPVAPVNHAACPQWLQLQYRGLHHLGLTFSVQRYFAYLADDGAEWDAALAFNDAGAHQDRWIPRRGDHQHRSEIYEQWSNFPPQNQGWLEVLGVVPFERAFAIDELGDEFVREPHVYAEFSTQLGPFTGYRITIESGDRWSRRHAQPDSLIDARVSKFAEAWRAPLDLPPYFPRRFFRP